MGFRNPGLIWDMDKDREHTSCFFGALFLLFYLV
jgi:hypothetical protein